MEDKVYILMVLNGAEQGKLRSEKLSKEIYRLMKPGDNSVYNMFPTINHPTDPNVSALIVEPNRRIKISPSANFENLFSAITTNPHMPQSTKDLILSKKNANGTMLVNDLLPANIKRYTHAELEELGWFNNTI